MLSDRLCSWLSASSSSSINPNHGDPSKWIISALTRFKASFSVFASRRGEPMKRKKLILIVQRWFEFVVVRLFLFCFFLTFFFIFFSSFFRSHFFVPRRNKKSSPDLDQKNFFFKHKMCFACPVRSVQSNMMKNDSSAGSFPSIESLHTGKAARKRNCLELDSQMARLLIAWITWVVFCFLVLLTVNEMNKQTKLCITINSQESPEPPHETFFLVAFPRCSRKNLQKFAQRVAVFVPEVELEFTFLEGKTF